MKSILYVAGFADDREGFYQFLGAQFRGATVTIGQGLWAGAWELQATVTVYAEKQSDVERVAALLCHRYNQVAVLLEAFGEVYTIDRDGGRRTIGRL